MSENREIIHAPYDETDLEVFRSGLAHDIQAGEVDPHRRTAALMFGIDEKDVTREQRTVGKTMNVAVTFRLSPAELSGRVRVSHVEAEEWFRLFHRNVLGTTRHGPLEEQT